jgi:uncharacterized protein YcaQ
MCIQSDPIDVAGRNADLTLQSRVVDYRPRFLQDLLYKERKLFEYFCKMQSILPIEAFPIFRHKMSEFEKNRSTFFKQHAKETRNVLKAVEEGPKSSRELEDMGKMKWDWGRNAKLSNILLTRLWVAGKLMVHHRKGAIKYYSLTEDILPPRIFNKSPPPKGEDRIEMARILLRASRLASASKSPEVWWEIGKTGEMRRILSLLEKEGDVFQIRIDGYGDVLYAPIEDEDVWLDPPIAKADYARFLAPLDPMLWNRALFKTIFGMEYAWEVYKKPHQRKFGYYCLPVVFEDRAVALIDPFYKKNEKVLEIRNFHMLSEEIDRKRFRKAFDAEIKRFCRYIGAKGVIGHY